MQIYLYQDSLSLRAGPYSISLLRSISLQNIEALKAIVLRITIKQIVQAQGIVQLQVLAARQVKAQLQVQSLPLITQVYSQKLSFQLSQILRNQAYSSRQRIVLALRRIVLVGALRLYALVKYSSSLFIGAKISLQQLAYARQSSYPISKAAQDLLKVQAGARRLVLLAQLIAIILAFSLSSLKSRDVNRIKRIRDRGEPQGTLAVTIQAGAGFLSKIRDIERLVKKLATQRQTQSRKLRQQRVYISYLQQIELNAPYRLSQRRDAMQLLFQAIQTALVRSFAASSIEQALQLPIQALGSILLALAILARRVAITDLIAFLAVLRRAIRR